MASSSHVEPGGEGKIIATVGIKGRRGIVSKTVKIYSNDPERPVVTLVLKSMIKAVSGTPATSVPHITPSPQATPVPPSPPASLPMSVPPRVTE